MISVRYKLKKTAVLLICFLILCWGVTLIHIEYLTAVHGEEFKQVVNNTCRIGDENFEGYYKILEYRPLKYARVYCVVKNQELDINYACELLITGYEGHHQVALNDTIWSRHGTADGVIWPYWWNFVYLHTILSIGRRF